MSCMASLIKKHHGELAQCYTWHSLRSMPCITSLITKAPWGISSVGRASALQAGGHRFESDILHYVYEYLPRPTVRVRYSPLTCLISSSFSRQVRYSPLHLRILRFKTDIFPTPIEEVNGIFLFPSSLEHL